MGDVIHINRESENDPMTIEECVGHHADAIDKIADWIGKTNYDIDKLKRKQKTLAFLVYVMFAVTLYKLLFS